MLVKIIVLLSILYLLTHPSRLSGLKSIGGRILLIILLVGVTMLHPLLGILFAVLMIRIPDRDIETMVTKKEKKKKTRFEVENRMKRPQDSNEIPTRRPKSLPPTLDHSSPTEVQGYHKTKVY